MTIEWLAGNRLRGTTAERPALGLPSGSVGGWVELARTTLGSTASTITVSSLADKRYYMVLMDKQPSGNFSSFWRLGNSSVDTGSNYAYRNSNNGGSDGTSTTTSKITNSAATTDADKTFSVMYVANLSGKEKLIQNHVVSQEAAGAGTAPDRSEVVGKWVNTSNPLNLIQSFDNGAGGNLATGAEMVVLGWDPTDTHTTNFWEELASVTLGSDGDVLSSGTITAKKYLWVQAFIKNSGTSARFNTEMTFNGDTGSNYSERRSLDGGTDATSTSQSKIMSSGVTGSDDDLWCLNMFVVNNSATEKLCIGHGFDTYAGSGAGTAPSQRFEKVAKWANTSSQITNITITNSDTSNYDAISELRVWGSD